MGITERELFPKRPRGSKRRRRKRLLYNFGLQRRWVSNEFILAKEVTEWMEEVYQLAADMGGASEYGWGKTLQ
jgi:hypothetical protein